MGKVITTLVITNRLDEAKAEDGLIPMEQVRSVTLENVLVDTGATTLCLPKDVIARLGFENPQASGCGNGHRVLVRRGDFRCEDFSVRARRDF